MLHSPTGFSPMTEQLRPLLGPGDLAPDFNLPAADRHVDISLSDYYHRGPVLLLLLRGLYRRSAGGT